MIKTSLLTKKIGEKEILRGVNLTVKEGETTALLGPNGAGKSTVLKIISGLLEATSGDVLINNMKLKANEEVIKKTIGFLSHSSYLYDHFSPIENLVYYGKLYDVEDIEVRAKELISMVGLSLFMHEPVRSFSRGMLQRIAIARAIIHSPSILLLDEPHTGLDQRAVSILNNVILQLKQEGTTIIMVTHDFHQLIETCDKAIVMKQGLLIDDFAISGAKNVKDIKEMYAGLVS
ncbi:MULTISPECIES: ABC transporter ATP-binding protein [Bacillaceae]|uniref:ABC transporter ATP-binding protein n=1 Tax=Bacillaceae TaxID=186817 RepID=UPI002A1819A1|nr:ABC transporter ATP-binding protein [Cytobacillus sp. IB215316]MDX8359499.1 ABC transporter ATP-binding protein [Cytobacillus sp. IB215316]